MCVDERKAKAVERKVTAVIARAQGTACAYKAGRWAVMRKAREAQNAVWDDAWDALAAAKAEADEEQKAQARQRVERAQAAQASAGSSSSDTVAAAADGVRSRAARAEARQAKRPRAMLQKLTMSRATWLTPSLKKSAKTINVN